MTANPYPRKQKAGAAGGTPSPGKGHRSAALLLGIFLAAVWLISPQILRAQTAARKTATGRIWGVVKSGHTPLPGATVTAIDFATRQRIVTYTDAAGNFSFPALAAGRYFLLAQMDGFAPGRSFAEIDAKNPAVRVAMDMILASRAATQTGGRPGRPGQFGAGGQNEMPGMPGSLPNGVEGQMDMTPGSVAAEAGAGQEEAASMQAESSMGAAASDTATESVAVGGNMSGAQMRGMSSAEIQQRVQDFQAQHEFRNGRGFRRGGPGGRPGRVILFFGGGRGRRAFDQPHGALFYTLGDSAFDAAPYSLTGQPTLKPSFVQHEFGATIGGPLNIPKLYHGGTKNFFFASYFGTLSDTPYDAFATVPTLAERQGNFSNATYTTGPQARQPVEIFDPATGQPFPRNTIPLINPAALELLQYIPKPNLPGSAQNFHYVTSLTDHANNFNFRLIHNFGATSGRRFGFFRRGGHRDSVNFGFSYRGSNSALTNPFPTLGGRTTTRSFDVSGGYARSMGRLMNLFRFDFNRSRILTSNLYADVTNVAGIAGITGVSQNPFDWGVPNLSFTNFNSLQDTNPILSRNQTFTFTDFMVWRRGKHTLRFGGDFRRIQINPQTDNNARGSFVFTGLNTAQIVNGAPVAGTGYDFADFLLGLPQSTSVQFGTDSYHFRGNSWDLFAQDDWHALGNFTVNFGLRYEYVSPFTETDNHIVNLDAAPNFTAVAPVLPGHSGPYTGPFPDTLLNPDRDNVAPRVGLAWRAAKRTVVRAGYGIDYNTAAYQGIVQQLAFQPPFSITQTNIESPTLPLTLENGFPAPPPSTITNNYGVDRKYQLGYAQIWDLDIQQQLPGELLLNVDYTGTKGTNLDILEAPNRTPTGLRIPDVQPFNWETSEGDSILHAGTIRLRKRLVGGIAIGGTYTFSKSIDNASSIGGGATVVAQNAFDLAAERGLSSFDQTHRFTGDYLWVLPFGHDQHWLYQRSLRRDIFGDWEWSGDWTIASGLPFTARVLGNYTEIKRGTNGTLRADVVPGQSATLPHPSPAEWFNTAAFVVPPAGQFGDVGRNTIRGPGTLVFDMGLTKVVPIGETRMLEIRAQSSNIFNRPQFTTVDTVVNSPTYGRVTAAGGMRTIQIVTRFRF